MASTTPVRRAASIVDDYLLVWILLAVGVGVAVPSLSALSPLSTPILAVMIAGVSLTLTPAQFRALRPSALATILLVQSTMPLVALALATVAGLPPALTAGFVVVGAVTPELVTPVMTELADGDTALATAALVSVGLGSVAFVPLVVALLLGDVAVDPFAVLAELAVAVVAPMTLAVGVRTRWPERVGRYDDCYPSVSALMVVLVIGIVAASNAALLTSNVATVLPVVVVAATLNLAGYALGWLSGLRMDHGERIAATLSVGMRDFAVAAALVLAAGFPPAAGLAAIVFGIVEMVSSAGLARYVRPD